jgi:hypothetical protein
VVVTQVVPGGTRQRAKDRRSTDDLDEGVASDGSTVAVKHETVRTHEAERSACDAVLGELYRRAVDGQEVVIRDRHGNAVATEKRPSDRLLLALAKAFDPERFGGRTPERAPETESWRAAMGCIMADPEATAALDLIADRMVLGDRPF